ncbi:MAG: phosphate ABC transporter substrate-binding/OmpA family protein [Bacillota bacterium]|nr:phosphate ABC transporter substrate-binding/OmpA family protein [Bacillota bacterium]
MNNLKLTLVGKITVFLLIVLVILVPTYMLGGLNGILNKSKTNTTNINNFEGKPASNPDSAGDSTNASQDPANPDNTINLSLDEWIGWKSILDANGGTETQKDSIYGKLGLNVKISIINDATQSSNALIKGDLNAAGYTVNRYSFLYDKFKTANTDVVMPYITNSSSGGDGIIAKKGINRIEDLVGKKVGVPRFSEAQTLVEWLISKSSLTQDDIKKIKNDMVFFDTPDDAAKAFFGGKIDAAATWQPYLTQAQSTIGAKVLFSTKAATNIILDGIIFRKDFYDQHNEQVQKFIEGSLKAESMYTTNFTAIKDSMPLFKTESDDKIKEMTADATLSNSTTNKELLNGIAQNLFSEMSNIWVQLGEKADPQYSKEAFDSSIIDSISKDSAVVKAQTPKFTEKQRESAKAQDDLQALLKTTLTINFQPNLAVIEENSFDSLNKFADIAKILNGSIIQIEGNVANVGKSNPEFEKKLSYERAKAVATYLQVQGVDSSRFVIIGNGTLKQIGNNTTKEGQVKNRRTDIFFKILEQ